MNNLKYSFGMWIGGFLVGTGLGVSVSRNSYIIIFYIPLFIGAFIFLLKEYRWYKKMMSELDDLKKDFRE